MYKYFIVYIYNDKNGVPGINHLLYKLDNPITYDDILSLEELIKKEKEFSGVNILNYKSID